MERLDIESMSEEAKELISIATGGRGADANPDSDFDLQATLSERPGLMPGLNEFVQWRMQQAALVDKADPVPSVAHGTVRAAISAAETVMSRTNPTDDQKGKPEKPEDSNEPKAE
jgi:hypothetical protein